MKSIITSILLVTVLVFGADNLWGAQFDVGDAGELHDALAKAEDNGEADYIHIFEGTYPGNFSYASTEIANLHLIGGYSDENDPGQDPSKTILDGGQRGPVLAIATCGGVVIRNLTIQNGNSVIGGGGILLRQSSKSGSGAIWLWNNIIQGNYTIESGGGVRMDASADDGATGTLMLMGNVIRENRAEKSGGGIYLTAGNESGEIKPGAIHLIGNEIVGNDSDWSGGGAYILSESDTGRAGYVGLSLNTINNNECHTSWNPSDRCNGGGVDIVTTSRGGTGISSPVELSKNLIMDNRITGYGGGVNIRTRSERGVAGAITLDENTILNNDAYGAGGAKINSSGTSSLAQAGDVSIFNNNIHGNRSERHYGGIVASSSSLPGKAGKVIVVNNMITSNRTDGWYGGLMASSDTVDGSGDSVTLTNNTISANEAGIAVGGVGALAMPGETLNVYNNIIRGNTAPWVGDMRVSCSGSGNTQNGFNNNYGDMFGAWTSQSNNINQDPLFIGGDNYHLESNSPCRDAGRALAPELPATDYDGDARIFGGAPDMGADEIRMVFIKPLFLSDLELNW
jgi:hypothetical protein